MKISPFDVSSNFEITDKGEKIFLPNGPFGSGYLIASDKKWKNLRIIFSVYQYLAFAAIFLGRKHGASVLVTVILFYWILAKLATVKAPLVKRRERYIVVVKKIASKLTVTGIIIVQLLLLTGTVVLIWAYFSGERTWFMFACIIFSVMLFIHGTILLITRIKQQ